MISRPRTRSLRIQRCENDGSADDICEDAFHDVRFQPILKRRGSSKYKVTGERVFSSASYINITPYL